MSTRRGLRLSTVDRERLARLLDEFSDRAHYKITLGSLLSSWDCFAAEVARGGPELIYEYANSLSSRDLIQNVIDELSPDGAATISAEMSASDHRFLDATIGAARSFDERSRWWHWRIPAAPTDELAQSLRSEGYLV